MPHDTGVVDFSMSILADGRGLVQNRVMCILCGQRGGLKMRCDREGCVLSTETREPTTMHVTCARQAGFEVRLDDKDDIYFYGTLLVGSDTSQ